MPSILLLGSQHGNELLGDRLYSHIVSNYPELLPHITFEIANPKAHAKNVRYIESDMNRSYDIRKDTYEAEQARRIETLITKGNFDVILDLHTTVCDQPPCIIVEDIYDENKPFLRATTIDKVVLMQCEFVKHTLIGRTKKALALEIANTDITPDLLDNLCKDLKNYIKGAVVSTQKSAYPTKELLLKSSISPKEAAELVNFELSKQGFVPILVGENSYKKNTEYLGFKAHEETIITL